MTKTSKKLCTALSASCNFILCSFLTIFAAAHSNDSCLECPQFPKRRTGRRGGIGWQAGSLVALGTRSEVHKDYYGGANAGENFCRKSTKPLKNSREAALCKEIPTNLNTIRCFRLKRKSEEQEPRTHPRRGIKEKSRKHFFCF